MRPADAPAPAPDARGVEDCEAVALPMLNEHFVNAALALVRKYGYGAKAGRADYSTIMPADEFDVLRQFVEEVARALAARADGAGVGMQEPGEFHWRDGWCFRRMEDGSVRVRHGDDVALIPAPEWESVVREVGIGSASPTRSGAVYGGAGYGVGSLETAASPLATPPSPRAGAVEHEPGCMWHAGEACDRACRYRAEAPSDARRCAGCGGPYTPRPDGSWLFSRDCPTCSAREDAVEQRERAERAEAALRERDEDAERWRFVRLLLGGALGAGHSHDMDGPEMCLRIGEHVLGTGRTHGLTDDLVTAAVDRARTPEAPHG